MDLKQLNAFLRPFNIEVTCDGCAEAAARAPNTSQVPYPGTLFPNPPETETKSQKREEKRSSRKRQIQKVSRGSRDAVQRPFLSDGSLNPRLREGVARPVENHQCFRPWQQVPPNPPNHFLNLNGPDHPPPRRPDMVALLEDSMKTPHKIGDVSIDHLMLSDRKGLSKHHHRTGTTFDAGIFDLEDFPEHPHGSSDGIHGTPLNHKIAFSGVPSKVASPCYTPVRFVVATPVSRVAKSPASALSVSPLPRFSLTMDGMRKKNSDFPMNLFYDSL